ncbi:hypothetical protein DJ71_21130 [Halorubrum sp. E3]|nr:hypothetical protein DJ71_21130 [Halorubrum sp. E3]OYR83946.1 hypothetical protein DJ72_06375 [Halorubrum distributum]
MSQTNHTTTDDPASGDASTNGDTTASGDASTTTDDPASSDGPTTTGESVHASYAFGVRIREETPPDGDPEYRFEAPNHEGIAFDDPDTAELYADVYFDVNGFQEAGTGDRGVPPAIIQAGRDTLVGYLLTQPDTGRNWIASYYGEKPEKIDRYVARVRKRARLIRERAAERGLTEEAD